MSRAKKSPAFLSVSEVAARRNVPVRTVRTACADGSLPATKVGAYYVVLPSDAATWTPRPRGYPKGRPRS